MECALAHNPDSGKAEAPTSEQLTRWTVDSLTCTQAAVQNLSPLFEEIETFLSGLPQWLDLLMDASVQGVEPSADLVQLFEGMGVRITATRMSVTEWVLILCSVAQMLEQRWLEASIVHQTAFSAYIRAGVCEAINKSLEQKLGEIRQSIEIDDEESLPFELQWIDRARALGPAAYWASV